MQLANRFVGSQSGSHHVRDLCMRCVCMFWGLHQSTASKTSDFRGTWPLKGSFCDIEGVFPYQLRCRFKFLLSPRGCRIVIFLLIGIKFVKKLSLFSCMELLISRIDLGKQ